jgi:hypothetical protein
VPLVLTQSTLNAWVLLRHRTWPAGLRPPNAAWWQAEAEAYFRVQRIPRSMMRAARLKCLPIDWRDPGPRGPRLPVMREAAE